MRIISLAHTVVRSAVHHYKCVNVLHQNESGAAAARSYTWSSMKKMNLGLFWVFMCFRINTISALIYKP